MKYFVFLFAIAAWGALGLIIGKGVAGTWREESNADKKARILNDPDVQTCTFFSEGSKQIPAGAHGSIDRNFQEC